VSAEKFLYPLSHKMTSFNILHSIREGNIYNKSLPKWRIIFYAYRYREEVSKVEETQEQITARIVAQAAEATAKVVAQAAQAAALVVAKENSTALTAIAVLQTEMTTLKNQQALFETEINKKMDSLSPKFDKIFTKLDDIAQGRPTWAVALIIGALFSLDVGLIVFTVTH
jgi:hypothetical protein